MNYLIGTNIFISLIGGEGTKKLSHIQKQVLSDINTKLIMSQASIFEMAIKYRLGKLFADKHFKQLLNQHIRLFDIKLLSIEKKHNENIINLPMILNSKRKPHADPFDLQIISQAQIEKLTVIKLDPYFVLYPIDVIE